MVIELNIILVSILMEWLKAHIVPMILGIITVLGAVGGSQIASESRMTRVETRLDTVEVKQAEGFMFVERLNQNSRDIQEVRSIQEEREYIIALTHENSRNISILINDAAQTAPLIKELSGEVKDLTVEMGVVKNEVVHTNKQLDTILRTQEK